MTAGDQHGYVSRGGLKLRAALDAFAIDPTGFVCLDLGCSTGGFTDSLLRAGAARVYAVDTAYGELAWSLRTDERVIVMERTNALHADPPGNERCDLAVIDLGWTPQRLAVPAASRWLLPTGRVVSLVKPHYEAGTGHTGGAGRPRARPVLEAAEAEAVARATVEGLAAQGFVCEGLIESPILGGKRKGGGGRGNREWLALLRAQPA